MLAAISQNYARKYATSIDALHFKYDVLNETYEDEEIEIETLFRNEAKFELHDQDGVILCGFFLDGGRWNRESNIILDSPLRFTALPHFRCQLVKVYQQKSNFYLDLIEKSIFNSNF